MSHLFGGHVPLWVKATVVSVAGVLVSGIPMSACGTRLAGAVSCQQALEDGIYDTPMKVYGTVSEFDNVELYTFILTSGGRQLTVHFQNMIEDNGQRLTDLTVDNVENGNRVIVTGALKSAGKYRTQNSFWAFRIDNY